MAKNAGAGRGFVNPQRTDESNEDYVTPKDRYEIDKERIEAKERKANESGYNKAISTMKKGGMASPSKRADGAIRRGHTKCACGGGKM